MKKIWLDITNSPHVILYNALLPKFKERGFEFVITTRDYAQTIELLDLFNIEYTIIGDHKGKNKFKKLFGLLSRSLALYKFARGKNFDASISMSSQYLMIASKLRNIPHMTLFDYEYSLGQHISFRLSKKIMSPAGVQPEVFKKYGAKMEKVVFYNGLKEQFFIDYYIKKYKEKYQHNKLLEQIFGIDEESIVVVIRPEATVAHYQSNSNSLSMDIVEYLSKHKSQPKIILLPRIASQKHEYEQKNYDNVIIPDVAINGIDLVAESDLVIGAGGSMNREAASIGIPVYTIYQGGIMCAVDKMLIKSKRMIHIESKEDFSKIVIEKKAKKAHVVGEDLSELYMSELVKLVGMEG